MAYKAEYIWIDGTKPTALLRSKTRVLADGADLPEWSFDGSSTNQADGHDSDCLLRPVFVCGDPIRGGGEKLVHETVLGAPKHERVEARSGKKRGRIAVAAVGR